MLLLNEDDIKPEIKTIFNKIKEQLIDVKSILENIQIKELYELENLNRIIDKLLNEKSFNLYFETLLNSNTQDYTIKNNLSVLMSIINLEKKEINLIEEEYKTKIPKEYKNKNDEKLIEEFNKLILNLNKHGLISNKEDKDVIFVNVIENDKKNILSNFMIKNVLLKPSYYKNIKSYLTIQSYKRDSQIDDKYFKKLFGERSNNQMYDYYEIKYDEKNEYNTVIAKKNNDKKLMFIDINKLEKIAPIEAVESGLLLNEYHIKTKTFYKDLKNIYVIDKETPVLNLNHESIDEYSLNEKVTEIDSDLLTFNGLNSIRKSVMLRKNNYQKSTIIKINNDFMYLTDHLRIKTPKEIEIKGLIVNTEKMNYFINNSIMINKNDIKDIKETDDFQKLFFLEMIHSFYSVTYTNILTNRTEKRIGLR